MYLFKDLNKRNFLKKNEKLLVSEISSINAKVEAKFGANALHLSKYDFWVLLNAEAGLKDGSIDPEAQHSLKERGLLPLPDNLEWWIDGAAPNWDETMPLDVNIHYFMLYLASAKNKIHEQRDGIFVFRDLFTRVGISGDLKREARVLAGLVHGYFSLDTYSDKKPPVNYLLNGYASDVSLPELMESTNYVYAGDSKIENRHKNIETALSWL